LDNEEIQQLLKTGIEAAQSGNKIIARHILEQVVSKEPLNEMGWLWLASVVDTVDERRECLETVLSINPSNERARQAISKLPRPTPSPTADLTSGTAASGARLGRAPSSATRSTPPAPSTQPPLFVPKSAPRRRRRIAPPMFALLAILAVGMIALGLALLYTNTQNNKNETPTATQPAAVVIVPTRPVIVTPGPSPTPYPVETLGPTWTPSNTPTATNTPLPTATPLPLSTYTLLASAKRDAQTTWAIYTLLASGADERKIPLSLAGVLSEGSDLTLLDTYDAAYSPDGVWVAFSARLRQGSNEFEDLFIVPANGGDMRRVTTLAANHVEGATWSPDGQQIAFASDIDGDFDIYVTVVDGGTPRPLTDNTAEDRYPAWSPDNQWIAFASDFNQPTTLEVWRMDPNGQNLKQLTDSMNSSFAPAWSPDSQSIVFVSDRLVNDDLYIMTANGDGERALLVRDVDANELDPAWSPDGVWIAFSSNREGPVYDLYLMRPDGSNIQRVTQREDDTRYVDWKP
jgi:Tol biopolymer transport system component